MRTTFSAVGSNFVHDNDSVGLHTKQESSAPQSRRVQQIGRVTRGGPVVPLFLRGRSPRAAPVRVRIGVHRVDAADETVSLEYKDRAIRDIAGTREAWFEVSPHIKTNIRDSENQPGTTIAIGSSSRNGRCERAAAAQCVSVCRAAYLPDSLGVMFVCLKYQRRCRGEGCNIGVLNVRSGYVTLGEHSRKTVRSLYGDICPESRRLVALSFSLSLLYLFSLFSLSILYLLLID